MAFRPAERKPLHEGIFIERDPRLSLVFIVLKIWLLHEFITEVSDCISKTYLLAILKARRCINILDLLELGAVPILPKPLKLPLKRRPIELLDHVLLLN